VQSTEGQATMQDMNPAAAASMAASEQHEQRMRNHEDLAYQAVTIVAILLLLGSLWVF